MSRRRQEVLQLASERARRPKTRLEGVWEQEARIERDEREQGDCSKVAGRRSERGRVAGDRVGRTWVTATSLPSSVALAVEEDKCICVRSPCIRRKALPRRALHIGSSASGTCRMAGSSCSACEAGQRGLSRADRGERSTHSKRPRSSRSCDIAAATCGSSTLHRSRKACQSPARRGLRGVRSARRRELMRIGVRRGGRGRQR